MCIYCGTDKYRKIYENHTGPIPKDEYGRTYEIHHIDGNHSNNDPNNLVAVTIQEHYNIHHSRKDWAACLLILSQRISKTPEELSALSKASNLARVEAGTHNFLGGEIQRNTSRRRVNDGTHNLLGSEFNLSRIANGEHHFLGGEIQRNTSRRRVNDGTHNFLGGKIQRKQVEDGTHPFLGSELNRRRLAEGIHPSQIKKTCPHCNKTTNAMLYSRWHGDKCKLRE